MRRGPGVGEPDALATLLVGADSLGPLGPRDPGAERECWGPELPAVPLNSSSGKGGVGKGGSGREGLGRGPTHVRVELVFKLYIF